MLLKTSRGTRVETRGVIWKWQALRATEAATLFESNQRLETVKQGFDPVQQKLVEECYRCTAMRGSILVELIRK